MHNTSYHSIGNSHSSIIANSRNNSHTRNTNHHSISNSSIDNNNLSNKDMSKKTNNNHIVEWVKANFSGGHLGNVNKLKNMSDLRFGVVIAQILTQIIPQTYHPSLLSRIEVSNLNTHTCIHNWMVIKQVLSTYITSHIIPILNQQAPEGGLSTKIKRDQLMKISQYNPEALYYRQHELTGFVSSIVEQLWEVRHSVSIRNEGQRQSRDNHVTYTNTIMGHLLRDQTQEGSRQQEGKGMKGSKNRSMEMTRKSEYNMSGIKKQKQSRQNRISNYSSIRVNTNNMNMNNVNLSQLSDIANNSYQQVPHPTNYQFTTENTNYSNRRTNSYVKPSRFTENHNKKSTSQFQQFEAQNLNEEQEQGSEAVILMPPSCESLSQNLPQWIYNKLYPVQLNSNCNLSQPHQLIGNLVNLIFASSRINTNPIIKSAHFKHGSIFVYRKVLQFLLTHPLSQRVNKSNVMAMMKTIQQEGVVREMEFWAVIQDLYTYDVNGGRNYRTLYHSHDSDQNNNTDDKRQQQAQKQNNAKHRKSIRSSKISSVDKRSQGKKICDGHRQLKQKCNTKDNTQGYPQGQNTVMNRKQSYNTLSKCKTSKQSLNTNKEKDKNPLGYICNNSNIRQIQNWLQHELGFAHTMSQIYQFDTQNSSNYQVVYKNPLINGKLVSSVLIRLKIAKPLLNKYPKSLQQIRNNWESVNKAAVLRGYEQFKKVCNILLKFNIHELHHHMKQLINVILSVIHQFRAQYNKKNPTRSVKTSHHITACNSAHSNTNNQLKCNYCEHPQTGQPVNQVTNAHKLQLVRWLSTNFGIELSNPSFPEPSNTNRQKDEAANGRSYTISVSQLTQICRQVLQVNIYKETTQKIQINNVQKILGELRRIGLRDYYKVRRQEVMDHHSDGLRWKVLSDLKWLIQGKIQFK